MAATFTGTLRSEFTKIRSVRSTYWSLLALVVITPGIGALTSFGAVHDVSTMSAAARTRFLATFDPAQRSLDGLILGQLIIAMLGTLTITSEYSTGMIRTSLTAMPRRLTFLSAKGAVFAVVALAVGLVASVVSFFAGQALMSGSHIGTTLGAPGALRAVVGGALFLAACGMLAFGLGAVIRHSAAAIATVIALLFVTFILVSLLPSTWQNGVDKWIPFNAGSQVWTVKAQTGQVAMLPPWTGFTVLCGYAATAIVTGLILFCRRDA